MPLPKCCDFHLQPGVLFSTCFGSLWHLAEGFCEEGLVEGCRERNLIRLLHGWGAVGKGREIQRGYEQCYCPADSWASVRRLKIQLGLGWVL